jgi:ankyrin repeat protein
MSTQNTDRYDGDTKALKWAIQHGAEADLYMMLDEGCVDSSADMNGSTPLHLAAFEGSCPLIEILLDFDADVFAVDTNGRTPAQVCLQFPDSVEHKQCFEILSHAMYNREAQS